MLVMAENILLIFDKRLNEGLFEVLDFTYKHCMLRRKLFVNIYEWIEDLSLD